MTEDRVDDDGGGPENHRNGPAGGALPRRSAQDHLEPQLRETRGAGNGTPFTAFGPVTEPRDPDGEAEDRPASAVFEGARRRRRPASD